MQAKTRNDYHAITAHQLDIAMLLGYMLSKKIVFKGEYEIFPCGDTGLVTLVYRHYVKPVKTRKPQKPVHAWQINDRLKAEMPQLAKAMVQATDAGYAIVSPTGVILTQSKTLIGLNKTVKKAVKLAWDWNNARWRLIHGTEEEKAKYAGTRHSF